MAAAHFLGKLFVLRKRQEAACGVKLVAFYYKRAVVQRGFGIEHSFNHLRSDLGVYYRSAFDNAFGQIVIGKNDERADVVFRHILYGADYLVHNKLYTGNGYRFRLTFLYARIEKRTLDFGVVHSKHYNADHCYYYEHYRRTYRFGKRRHNARKYYEKAYYGDEFIGFVVFKHLEHKVKQNRKKYKLQQIRNPPVGKFRSEISDYILLYCRPDCHLSSPK